MHPSSSTSCLFNALDTLHHSAFKGSVKRVSSILSQGPIEVNEPCCFGGKTPIMYAADGGHSRVIDILLKAGAVVTHTCDGGVTALHISAIHGHEHVTNLLLAAGADPEAVDVKGYTPLLCAALRRKCGVMEALVAAGANVDHALPDGATPVYLAAEMGGLTAVRVLLAANADPNIKTNKGSSPLEIATEMGHEEVVRELIPTTKVYERGGFESGSRALHIAAQTGRVSIMEILYQAGLKDEDSAALCAAVSFGGREAIQFLLQRPNIFSTACTSGSSYVNHQNKSTGLSPLLCCLRGSSPKTCTSRVLHMLIDAGVDAATIFEGFCENKSVGYTSLDVVNTRISSHLEKHGLGDDCDIVRSLRGLRRLLMTVDAIHAVSWGWNAATTPVTGPHNKKPGTQLPIMRRMRKATKTRVVLRALFRCESSNFHFDQ